MDSLTLNTMIEELSSLIKEMNESYTEHIEGIATALFCMNMADENIINPAVIQEKSKHLASLMYYAERIKQIGEKI